MTTFKKHQVVMLPTNEKADLRIGKTHGVLHYKNNIFDESLGVYQHLYFLSDEEIKEGDWYIHNQKTVGLRVQKCVGANLPIDAKKIVATTDKLMLDEQSTFIYGYKAPLPQPSQSFIGYFVEEYNKGNVITEVEVEYEKWIGKNYVGEFSTDQDFNYKLKINPDNTINLKPKKDSWNREEITPLIDFLKEIAKDNLDRVSPGIKMRAMTYLAAFEKNLYNL